MQNGKVLYPASYSPEDMAAEERAWSGVVSKPALQDQRQVDRAAKLAKTLKPKDKKGPSTEDIISALGAPPPPSETAERRMPSPEKTSMMERTAMAQAQLADMINARAGINSNYTGQVIGLVDQTRANREADLMRRAHEKARAFGARQDWQRAEMLGSISQLTRMAGAERESAEAERAREMQREMMMTLTPAQQEQFAIRREELGAQRGLATEAGERQERMAGAELSSRETLARIPYEKLTPEEKRKYDIFEKKVDAGIETDRDRLNIDRMLAKAQVGKFGVEARGAEEAIATSKAQRRTAELAASLAEAEAAPIHPTLADMIQLARGQADAVSDTTFAANVQQAIDRALNEYRLRIRRGEPEEKAAQEAARIVQGAALAVPGQKIEEPNLWNPLDWFGSWGTP